MSAPADIRATGARVLVTGAGGLIGRHLPAALAAAGLTPVCLTRRGGGDITGDLLAGETARIVAEAGASHLLHLAWHDGADRWNAEANLDWIAASLALVRDFARAGGRRAVMVGSCAEYDWTGPGRLSEASPLRPATLYGAAKAATGLAALAAAPGLGLSLAWARPFFCYGPGEPEGRLFGDIIRGLRAGRPVDTTDGLQRRDFLHAADIARALVAILQSGAEGAVNVGSGRAVELRRVIAELARGLGGERLIRFGARPRPAGDPPLIEAETARLRDEIGFRPAFDLSAGIADVLAAEGVGA